MSKFIVTAVLASLVGGPHIAAAADSPDAGRPPATRVPSAEERAKTIAESIAAHYPLRKSTEEMRATEGRSFWVKVIECTLSKNGKLFARISTRSREALSGFRSETTFVFRDSAGNILHSVTTPPYGVSGEYTPGAHSRTDTFETEIPVEVLVNTRQMDVYASRFRGPSNALDELKKVVDQTREGLRILGVDPDTVFRLLRA